MGNKCKDKDNDNDIKCKDNDKDNNSDNDKDDNSIIETISINTNTEENKHNNINNHTNTYNNTTNINNHTTTTTNNTTTNKHNVKNNRNIPSDIQISHSFIKSFSIDYSKNINYNYIKKYYFPTWMNRLCKIYLALKSIYKFNSNKNITTILSVINKSLERMVGYRVNIEDIIKINKINYYSIICGDNDNDYDGNEGGGKGDGREYNKDGNNNITNKNITATKHTTNKHTTNNKDIKIINIIEINNEYILYPLLEENEFYAICYEYIKIQYKIFIKDNEDNEDKSIMFNPRAINDIDYNNDSGSKGDNRDGGDGDKDKNDSNNNTTNDNTTTINITNNTTNNIAKNRCMNILNRIRNREIERRNRYILSNKNNDIRDRVLQVFSIEDKRCIRLEYLYSRLNRITDNKILLRKYIIDIKELEIRKIENEEYVFHI